MINEKTFVSGSDDGYEYLHTNANSMIHLKYIFQPFKHRPVAKKHGNI